eukprot:4766703-Amphidinium_carterae.1
MVMRPEASSSRPIHLQARSKLHEEWKWPESKHALNTQKWQHHFPSQAKIEFAHPTSASLDLQDKVMQRKRKQH